MNGLVLTRLQHFPDDVEDFSTLWEISSELHDCSVTTGSPDFLGMDDYSWCSLWWVDQPGLERLISRRDHLTELKVKGAAEIMLIKLCRSSLVVIVVNLEAEQLGFFEKVIHLKVLHKLWIQVVPNDFRLAKLDLHLIAFSVLLDSVKHNKCIRQ